MSVECLMSSESFSVKDALVKVVSSACAKFVESVDVSVVLGVDVKKSEEQIRGVVVLPKSLGREVRVAVFARNGDVSDFPDLGVDDVFGGEELIDEIRAGRVLKVDWCITTPDFMPLVSKIAKILGPKGLMPNPKFGTVAASLSEKVRELKSGRVLRYKTDKFGIIHAKIGNVKSSMNDLVENFEALVVAIKQSKPDSVKGSYFKSVFLGSTMGKSFRILVDNKG